MSLLKKEIPFKDSSREIEYFIILYHVEVYTNVNLMLLHAFHSHNLLDAKINMVLSFCHDQAILNSVQAIIQNMIACEDTSQQQLHYLQSCGFGGLWRFAGPYTNVITHKC